LPNRVLQTEYSAQAKMLAFCQFIFSYAILADGIDNAVDRDGVLRMLIGLPDRLGTEPGTRIASVSGLFFHVTVLTSR
jgi:hypothetical protein